MTVCGQHFYDVEVLKILKEVKTFGQLKVSLV